MVEPEQQNITNNNSSKIVIRIYQICTVMGPESCSMPTVHMLMECMSELSPNGFSKITEMDDDQLVWNFFSMNYVKKAEQMNVNCKSFHNNACE